MNRQHQPGVFDAAVTRQIICQTMTADYHQHPGVQYTQNKKAGGRLMARAILDRVQLAVNRHDSDSFLL
jgi:hypothetical protein